MTPNALNMHHSSKTLLKSLQKHCQTVFSRFLSMTIFIPAEDTQKNLARTLVTLLLRKDCVVSHWQFWEHFLK
jgi:hypothetical protein